MSEKMKAKSNKILVLLATSELAHSFLYVTYTIFLISKGVSLYHIAILSLICGLAAIVFDIPTGAFADVVGRKMTYIISCLMWVICSVVYISATDFIGYAVAEVLAALAMSFANGCVGAHLWDTVTSIGQEQGLTECEIKVANESLNAKTIWVTSPISALGGFMGAKLFELGPNVPWISTGIGMVITATIATFVFEEVKVKKIEFVRDIREMANTTGKAFKILAKHRRIRNIAITRTLFRVTTVPIFLYWAAYLKDVGSSVTVLGWSWILMEVAMSLGVYLVRRVPEKINPQRIILVCALLVGFSAVFAAWTKSFVPVLIAILVIEAANMALGYLFGNITQKEITDLGYGDAGSESNMRATILSSVSTSVTVGGMFGEYTFGHVATSSGISNSWFVAGFMMVAGALIMSRFVTFPTAKATL